MNVQMLQPGPSPPKSPYRNEATSADLIPGSSALLTQAERERLADCERRIASNLGTFLETGSALKTIRTRQLYRVGYGTFANYCLERWLISPEHAHRLMAAAEFAERLAPMGDISLPRCEQQIRPLLKLPWSLAVKAWRIALNLAGGCPVTSDHIQRSIAEVTKRDRPIETRAPDTVPLKELLLHEVQRMELLLNEHAIESIPIVLRHMQFLLDCYAPADCEPVESSIPAWNQSAESSLTVSSLG
jgi:hypothetical protein